MTSLSSLPPAKIDGNLDMPTVCNRVSPVVMVFLVVRLFLNGVKITDNVTAGLRYYWSSYTTRLPFMGGTSAYLYYAAGISKHLTLT